MTLAIDWAAAFTEASEELKTPADLQITTGAELAPVLCRYSRLTRTVEQLIWSAQDSPDPKRQLRALHLRGLLRDQVARVRGYAGSIPPDELAQCYAATPELRRFEQWIARAQAAQLGGVGQDGRLPVTPQEDPLRLWTAVLSDIHDVQSLIDRQRSPEREIRHDAFETLRAKILARRESLAAIMAYSVRVSSKEAGISHGPGYVPAEFVPVGNDRPAG